MGLKKIERISEVDNSRISMRKLGVNLFPESKCKVIDRNTGEKPVMKAWIISSGECIEGDNNECYLSDVTRDVRTNDMLTDKVDIIYDLGKITDVNKIYMKGFFSTSNKNYTLSEFEIYAAETEDKLFDSESIVVAEKPEDEWFEKCKDFAEWLYAVEGTARYIAIRVVKSNPTDDITRINYLAAFSDTETKKRKYIIDKRDMSILKGLEPKTLTDGLLYDETVSVNGKETFDFGLSEKTSVSYIWVIGKGEFEAEAKGFALEKITLLQEGRKEILLKNDSEKAVKSVSVIVKGECEIDQIGAYNNKRYMEVDFEDVICDDFMGIGACVIPTDRMDKAIEKGFNDVHWEVEKCRIEKARPNVVRVWFQLDWFGTDYEDYKNGNYHFDSEKMMALYEYFDEYKKNGIEIELDFGWKIDPACFDWFPIESEPNKRASAPRELDLFAKSCVATLKELIENRGYDNIKYLTFYNEATCGGDFCVGECGYSKVEYWSMMLNECYKAVKESGIDIKIWGMENAGGSRDAYDQAIDWIEYMKEHCPGELDAITYHRYKAGEKTALMEFSGHIKAAEGLPVILSECGQNYDYANDQTWLLNNTQLFCNLTECGFSGALIWCLSGAIFPSLDFTMENTIDMFGIPSQPNGINRVQEPFYEWAMLSRYIPNHWKSVKSSVVDNAGENRIAAFTNGEDYTVVVEVKDSSLKRDIAVNLGKKIGKKFYKHVYKIPYCRDGNAIIPPVSGEIFADDTLKDTVNSGYQAIVYTTLPPITQIRVGTPELYLEPKHRFALSGEVVDGEGNIIWEKIKEIGNSITVRMDGLVVASEDAKSGDMCAIKAYSEDDPSVYTIVVVKIK